MLEHQRELMVEERLNEIEDAQQKKDAFIKANGLLKDEKAAKKEKQAQEDALDRINYFPFTHGDMIEKQRGAL